LIARLRGGQEAERHDDRQADQDEARHLAQRCPLRLCDAIARLR
jgi:hypothetical protein